MFEEKKNTAKKSIPAKKNVQYKQVSPTVVFSCYAASLIILVLAVSEAAKSFNSGDTRTGAFYIVLAVLGVLFSVFITVMNNRNRKLLGKSKLSDGKQKK